MAGIKNDDLREVYQICKTIENVLIKEIRRVNGNKSYLDKIVPTELIQTYSLKDKTALAFVDNLMKASYDNSVIALVSTFERIVFAKYRGTYGVLRTVVKTHTPHPLNYYNSRENFVNDGIEFLSGIISLIENKIDSELLKNFEIIKKHRNYIAHGKRDSEPPAFEFSITDMAFILDNIIDEIEK